MLKLRKLILILILLCPSIAVAEAIEQFEGTYEGEAEFVFEGKTERRDMSTTITATKNGFILSWTSVSYKSNDRIKSKTYTIEFVPSSRDNIYKSAMKNNLFGKATPLDPLRGEPFVWARFEGDTLSVFSLFINDIGDYEMQEFHRTLVDEGLDLVFRRIHDAKAEKEIRTILVRVD
ncbi:hypothetical protein [Sulfitobacter sp.]|uniref:hypothetical protein n=1 Tax=Sulfitobacter sp. TaxID=1903071 RepID=UPI0030024E9E